MKKRSAVLLLTTCTALCALVWPQPEQPKNVPIEPEPPAVCAEIASVENQLSVQPEPIPTKPLVAEEEPTIAEKEEVLVEQADAPVTKAPSQPVSPPQAPADLIIEPENATAPDNCTWVPGFGYVENGGSNVCYYAEDIYENGNKIGIMDEQVPCPQTGWQLRNDNNVIGIIPCELSEQCTSCPEQFRS